MIRKNVEAYTTVLFFFFGLVSNASEKGAKNRMPSRKLLQKQVKFNCFLTADSKSR
jgi:hypothetical protein